MVIEQTGFSTTERIVATILLSVLTFIGVFGNAMICIFFRGRSTFRLQMFESRRFLIINLALADLIKSMDNVIYLLNLSGFNLTLNYPVCRVSGTGLPTLGSFLHRFG